MPRPSSPDIVITARSPVPLIHGWDTLPPWGSDHKVLIFRAARGHRQVLPKRPPHYVWAKADWEEFQKEVEQRSPTSPDLGIQERSDRLSAAIRSAIREHVPRASGKRPHQPWWTQELSLLEKQKRLALTASEGDPFDADKLEAYGQAKESFTAAAHLAKGTYWRKVVAGINFGTSLSFLFGIIRSIDGRSQRCSLPPLLDGQSQRTTSREKADLLGKCLAETCKAKEEGAPSRFQPTYGPEPEPDDGIRGATGEITPEELDRAIEDLQKKESLDPQGLCSTALKNLGPEARKSMLLLFNESWKQGTIPSQWKDAYVVPVHKPGKDRSSPQGYRPIALTCVSAKLMEMVVKNRLVHITESPDFPTVMPYTNIQGGFREDRGTEEQVFSIIASLDEARSQGEFACFLSFDLVSAFDTVDHDRLLRILERRGIPQRFVLWLRAFLEDRTARFKVDGVLGKSFGLQSGVPQGTVLGPVLFLLCIDDLGGSIFFNWKRGDNSAAPLLVFNSTREEIQPDPHDASWGFNNCRFVSHGDMRVHHGKHVVAHNGIPVRSGDDLRPRNETTSIEVATTLNWVTRHRFLGLIIDDELSFRPHVNYVLDRLSQRMIILRRTCMKSWDLSVSTNRKVYLTYVLPVITHCLAAYGPFLLPRPGCPKPGLLAVLESRHRAALSYVLGCRKGVSAFIVQREAPTALSRSLSYNAVEILDEETAQEAATQAGTEDPKVAWVLSDSQSLATELSLGAHRQKRRLNQLIWLKFGSIVKRGYTLILQFVFGHCKLAGNDHADSLAKKAAKLAYELSLSPEMVVAVGVSRPPPFSYVEATNRFKLFLFREDGERGAKAPVSCVLSRQHGSAMAEKILAGLHLLGDRSGSGRKALAGGLTITAVDHPEDASVMDVDADSTEEVVSEPSDALPEGDTPHPTRPPRSDAEQPEALVAAVSHVVTISEQLRSSYREAVERTQEDLVSGFRSITEGMNAKFAHLTADIRAQSEALANTRSELAAGLHRHGTNLESSHQRLSEAVRQQSVSLEATQDQLATMPAPRLPSDVPNRPDSRGTRRPAPPAPPSLAQQPPCPPTSLPPTSDTSAVRTGNGGAADALEPTQGQHDKDRRAKTASTRERARDTTPDRVAEPDCPHQLDANAPPSAGRPEPLLQEQHAPSTPPSTTPPPPDQQPPCSQGQPDKDRRAKPRRRPLAEPQTKPTSEAQDTPLPQAEPPHAAAPQCGNQATAAPAHTAPAPRAVGGGRGATRMAPPGQPSAPRRAQQAGVQPPRSAALPPAANRRRPERGWGELSTLKFISFNCNSFFAREKLSRGLDSISRGIAAYMPDILLLQETKLSSKSPPPVLNGYRVFRRDRGGLGGGVATFVRSNLHVKEIPVPAGLCNSTTECVAIEITRIGLPALQPFPMDDTVVIAGDLNAHHPDWSHGAINACGRNLKDWLVEVSAVVSNNPAVHTMPPRPGIRNSSPDVAISSRIPGFIRNWRRLDSWESDHYPVAFEVPRGYRQPRPPRLTWFSWKRADWEEMMLRLDEESATLLAKRPATNTQFAKRIASCFRRAIHDFVPKYTQGRAYKAWWTPELTTLEREKAAAFAELQAEPDSSDKICAHLEKICEFKEAATQAKTCYWDRIAGRINRCTGIALLFRQVRMLDGRRNHLSIPPLRNGEGFCVEAEVKAEILGRHLESVCGGANTDPPRRWAPKNRPSDDDVGCGRITEDELDRALKDLDPKTSLDPDGICTEFLSRLDGGAKQLILELLNISWGEGFVPDTWRDAHVIPVAKPGRDHSLPEGYRPISLTSVTSKLMEVIVKNRLVFLTENEEVTQVLPFCTRQGGFRKQRGTEEQLYSVMTTIDCAVPTRRRVCLLSFDLANAFDTVDHALLLDAMQSKGVPPKFLVWLESFLRNRRAAFKVDGATGSKFHLKHGVPQGTVLGPILFLYHIDGLGTSLEALNKRIVEETQGGSWITFSLFADDDGVVVSSPSRAPLEKYTQMVVDVVEDWTIEAKMHLSKLKTEAVLFRDPGAPEPVPLRTRFNATAVDVTVPADYAATLKSRSAWKFLEPEKDSPWHQHHGKIIISLEVVEGGRMVTIRVADGLRWVGKTKLLGLTIDSELTFHHHMQRVVDNFSLKMNFLRHLSGKSFGCNTCTLRTLYLTYVLPTYTYALSVYGPYLLRSTSPLVATLERLHNRALILLLGCRKNTSEFSAQQESGILPLRAIARLRIAALRERMRRRGTLWRKELAMHSTMRRDYVDLCEKADTDGCKREEFVFNPFAPWTPSPRVSIVATLPGKKGDSPAAKRRIVVARLNELEPTDCSAWVDGSVLKGEPPPQPPPSIADNWDERHLPWLKRYNDKTTWGGAGLYFVFEPSITDSLRNVAGMKLTAAGDRRTTTRSFPVGKYAHSYRAEQVALYSALVFYSQHLAPTTRPLHILILSDSQSFLKTLSAGPHAQVEPLAIECWKILSDLEARGYLVTLQFVYGHCGLEGNDVADNLAKTAALAHRQAAEDSSAIHPDPYPLTVADAICRYRRYLRLDSSELGAKGAFERADEHGNISPFARIVHGRPIPRRRHLTARAEREIRQLRTGHHRLIMTLYSASYVSLSSDERRWHFLP
ncbi:putative RNA-directed DNA polymerase from transposon BS, partial [Diplonema papillatum]